MMVGSHQDAKVRQFAMYVFEVLSEINVNTEELQSQSQAYMTIFEKGLTDSDNNRVTSNDYA